MLDAVGRAALGLSALGAEGARPAILLECGMTKFVADGQPVPTTAFPEFEKLR